jgi:hypothetical protein
MLGWDGRIRTYDPGTRTQCLTAWPRPIVTHTDYNGSNPLSLSLRDSTHEYFSAEKFRGPASPPSRLRPCELPPAALTPILGHSGSPQNFILWGIEPSALPLGHSPIIDPCYYTYSSVNSQRRLYFR